MSSGSRRWVREIADCTSAAAASMSRSRSNSMTIEVLPWVLLALMVLMPSIVANCLMRGVATDFAMVSGDAPGSEAETLMVGKSVRGSAATGSRPNANRPPTISAIDISSVATGRRMQSSETFIALPRCASHAAAAAPCSLHHLDRRARRQAVLTVHHHAPARPQAGGHGALVGIAAGDGDLAHLGLVVLGDDEDEQAVLADLERDCRDDGGLRLDAELDLDIEILAGPQRQIVVGELRLGRDGAGSGVDRAVDEDQVSVRARGFLALGEHPHGSRRILRERGAQRI